MDFTGKRVLITGSSRGIGRAAAEVLLAAGATVAVNGRSATSTAEGIGALGGGERLVAAPGDVGTVAGCNAIVAAAVAAMGGLDVLVNSAGIGDSRPMTDCDEAMWDATMNINLKGTFFCIQAAFPHLKKARGNIVNVAADAGLIGEKGLSVYCASKAGVVNLTRALALELAPEVRVNSIVVGQIETPGASSVMTEELLKRAAANIPMRRLGQGADIAA